MSRSSSLLQASSTGALPEVRAPRGPAWLRDLVPPVSLIAGLVLAWHLLAAASGLESFELPAPADQRETPRAR